MNARVDAPSPAKPTGRRRGMLLAVIAVVTLVLAIAWLVYYLAIGRWAESTDDAYVDGNVVQITPQIAGTVTEIGAEDGDLVRAGQVLVRFDGADSRVAEQQAEANLARAVRQVRGLFSNVNSARADQSAQHARLLEARADYARRKGLAATGAISQEELAHAEDALLLAEQSLAGSDEQVQLRTALVDDTVIASHPDVRAAAAALRAAWLNDARTTLSAPVTGYVAMRSVQLGSRVEPGTPLMAVVPLNQVWINANFKETQLGDLRIGQRVTLDSDLYGGSVSFHGRIESLGVGTGSAFSLLPAQNATGNWIKIVQRVPVRVAVDAADLEAHPLRIGLSMSVSADLHDQNGPVLAQTPRSTPLLTTDIFDRQLADANERVMRIIDENMGGSTASPTGPGQPVGGSGSGAGSPRGRQGQVAR